MDGLSVKKKEYMPLRKSAAYNHRIIGCVL